MDEAELETYRRHHRRVSKVSWISILSLSIGCGVGVGYAWSFLVSVPLMIVLVLVGLDAHLRYEKVRWLKRFPELADRDDWKWRRRYGL